MVTSEFSAWWRVCSFRYFSPTNIVTVFEDLQTIFRCFKCKSRIFAPFLECLSFQFPLVDGKESISSFLKLVIGKSIDSLYHLSFCTTLFNIVTKMDNIFSTKNRLDSMLYRLPYASPSFIRVTRIITVNNSFLVTRANVRFNYSILVSYSR